MDSECDPTREAYDHYLPASKYPFNSVNLRNLAPACYKCNSQNKGSKDPLQDGAGIKKKAFYSFAANRYPIQISIHIKSANHLPKNERDIQISLRCAGHDEEIETWDRIYRIRERYKAKCLSASGAKYWLQRIVDESKNYHQPSETSLSEELEQCEKFPWHESNFLKGAFYDTFRKVGLV